MASDSRPSCNGFESNSQETPKESQVFSNFSQGEGFFKEPIVIPVQAQESRLVFDEEEYTRKNRKSKLFHVNCEYINVDTNLSHRELTDASKETVLIPVQSEEKRFSSDSMERKMKNRKSKLFYVNCDYINVDASFKEQVSRANFVSVFKTKHVFWHGWIFIVDFLLHCSINKLKPPLSPPLSQCTYSSSQP